MPFAPATVTLPVLAPRHRTFVCEVIEPVTAVGCVMTVSKVVVQLCESVMVHVYVPAQRLVTDGVPSPVGFPGVQLKLYAAVPPEGVTVEAPLHIP